MRRFYTTYEAAHALGVSLPTIVNWIKARRLKAHRTPGGHRRIAREDLAAFMNRHGMPVPPELADAVHPRKKVLVVAGAGVIRDGMARQLASAGYEVVESSPGFSAGAAAARFQPDVVVLDTGSPDGGETLEGLRSDGELAAVPVVGVGRSEWAERLVASGCTRAIGGPLEEGTLVSAAGAVLRLDTVAGRRPRR
jgi:excisionase family DNA binding protein